MAEIIKKLCPAEFGRIIGQLGLEDWTVRLDHGLWVAGATSDRGMVTVVLELSMYSGVPDYQVRSGLAVIDDRSYRMIVSGRSEIDDLGDDVAQDILRNVWSQKSIAA